MGINLNNFAIQIAKKEGKKKQVNIAQIKEILKITLQLLAKRKLLEVIRLLKRYKK